MAVLWTQGDNVTRQVRRRFHRVAWWAMELALLLVLLHLVVVPAWYLLMSWVGWEAGPTYGWWDASLWAVPVLLVGGPILMTVGDRLDARRRRQYGRPMPASRSARAVTSEHGYRSAA